MNLLQLTVEQVKAYERFIKARNKVGIVRQKPAGKWIRHADVVETVEVGGFNHPFYTQNDDWLEYKEAFSAWLAVEPEFRDEERLRSSRGDYGQSDNWDERKTKLRDVYSTIKEEVQ
jgi:hypothetical protein